MSEHTGMHEGHNPHDATGKKVGALAALLAIGLTLVTIQSHRMHTHGIVARSEANDQWAFYQSKRIKYHTVELGLDLIHAQGLKGDPAEKTIEKLSAEKERQSKESKEIKEKAEEKEKESHHAEERALRFDFAEGLFEIALVMSSLYFLSHKKLFPAVGLLAGTAGLVVGILGFLK
ncbi:MAG TPA: DUF4337 domain-containing protein [Planctomycetota bacterium]|nr:DUF4337 domain-containing protein [Planctomycetota bacterium]